MARVRFYFLTGVLAVFIVTGPAFGAQYDWTGWYIGLNSGGTWSNSDVSTKTVFSPTGYFASTSVTSINHEGKGSVNSGGFTGGWQGGFNWQTGNFVLGL